MRKLVLAVLSLMLVPVLVHATPFLGVATDEYAYNTATAPNDDYIKYFVGDSFIPAQGTQGTDNHGFVVGKNGSTDLKVFVNMDHGNATQLDDVPHVYLFFSRADSNINNSFSITYIDPTDTKNPVKSFAPYGSTFNDIKDEDGGIHSYTNLFGGIFLSSTTFHLATKQNNIVLSNFYLRDFGITYEGLALDDYFFVVADVDHNYFASKVFTFSGQPDQHDRVSPKTSSAVPGYDNGTPVPEPASLSLLGMGLLGMISLKLKRK